MEKNKQYKAIALISGGLDSLLAAKVVQEQNIDIIGVCFIIQFASKDSEAFRKRVHSSAVQINVPVRFVDISEDFLKLLHKPKHGFGANMNPCIDCKILMLKKAKEMMEKEKASFIVTGEVLGERPMSQNKASLRIIKNNSGLEGLLLRPLSARRLKATTAEDAGIIDRAKLLDIEGRSRVRQIKLAGHYGITDYFTPAGGCLLTDPIFANKLKELIEQKDLSLENIELLKIGRHFRIDKETKVIIGRDESENNALKGLKREQDTLLRLVDDPGPYALINGKSTDANIKVAGALAASYSKSKNKKTVFVEFLEDNRKNDPIEVVPMKRKETEKILIT